MSGSAIRFNRETHGLALGLIPRADIARIHNHPSRVGRDLLDFESELLIRGLNQPELVRREEAASGRMPAGYFDVEVETAACVDADREVFDVVIRIVIGPYAGRRIVVRLWYPPADMSRPGPHQHFNLAVGLRPEDRLFGRELEIEGLRVRVKFWRQRGVERFHFFRTAARAA